MESVEIRFSGSGGQGLILAARILASTLVAEGKNVAQSQSYEPVSRGGLSRSDLVVSSGEADYPLSSGLDFLLILDEAAASASIDQLAKNSVVLVDSELVTSPPKGSFTIKSLPFTETARKLGNKRVANIVALGALTGGNEICDNEKLEATVKAMAPAKFFMLNLNALKAGRELLA